jgi:hypothetical protein
MSNRRNAVTIAWLIAGVYCVLRYSLRSAPSAMVPELGTAFALNAIGVASLVGLLPARPAAPALAARCTARAVGSHRWAPRRH